MQQMPYQPLACALYDEIEIACLHRYDLAIELISGATLEGQALTTETSADKQEFLIIRTADDKVRVRLDQLQAITALTPGASFKRIEMNKPDSSS
ncbi:Rho-binding antiterminator [Pseudomonas sp. S9]|uniref:Rho-binding antiterminator n=1 Tax=Pseudomonas sp. S9 TaxID=686578 RepID=UPI0002556A52|nr:Rho-binding antiterminator [Pseudomonas sp. S9]